jgi:thioredoxin reductase (NADPH)
MKVFMKYCYIICLFFVCGCIDSTQTLKTAKDQIVNKFVTPKVVEYLASVDEEALPVVVLGGGVGGLMSAVYLSQAGIPVVLIEGEKPGGALAQSHSVRNWPGEAQVSGQAIMQRLRGQALVGGNVVIQKEKVIGVDFKSRPYRVFTQDLVDDKNKEYKTHCCIIAMGNEPNYLKIQGETGPEGYWGHGVTNCAICDGALYKGKTVGVVGGGDSAITEADYLAGLAAQVYIFVRKNTFRANNTKAKEQVLAKPNVKVLFNSEIRRIVGDRSRVTHVEVLNNQNNVRRNVALDGLFLAIGSRPNTGVLKGALDLDELGHVILKNRQESSMPGIYAVGDISGAVAQAVVAAGDGAQAALQLIQELKAIGYEAPTSAAPKKIKKQKEQPEEEQVEKSHSRYVVELHTPEDFDDVVVKSDKPVILDLFATLCVPCQEMTPVIEKLAEEFKSRAVFAKLNITNKNINIEALLSVINAPHIASVPTFLFIRNGKAVASYVGKCSAKEFKEKMIEALF